MDNFHTPVLLNEAIEYLDIKSGEKYIDATLGGGGHSAKIVEMRGKVLSIDQDEEAIRFVTNKFIVGTGLTTCPMGRVIRPSPTEQQNWILYKGNFANIEEIVKETGFTNIAGVLFDLGLSSHQLEEKSRGFSFDSDEELDMRMDRELAVKANVLVNGLTKKELEKIFLEYGEETAAWKIAAMIERERRNEPIVTCRQLAEICRQASRESRLRPARGRGFGEAKHPATQVFQALRIVVNDELGSLEKGLDGSFNILKRGGRIVVISFHSLEDRIVKKTFRAWEKEKKGEILTEQIIQPSEREIAENPRSRSAKLRAFQKR